jgi:hypothetical protein
VLTVKIRDLGDDLTAGAKVARRTHHAIEALVRDHPEEFVAARAANATDAADEALAALLHAFDTASAAVQHAESAWLPITLAVGLGEVDDARTTSNRELYKIRAAIERIATRPTHLRASDDLRDGLRLVTWSTGPSGQLLTFAADHPANAALNVQAGVRVRRGEPILPSGAPRFLREGEPERSIAPTGRGRTVFA